MTKYQVLKKMDGGATWKPVAIVSVSSAEAAIRKHVEAEKAGGEFVAIPARSWVERKVSLETKTQVKFSDSEPTKPRAKKAPVVAASVSQTEPPPIGTTTSTSAQATL